MVTTGGTNLRDDIMRFFQIGIIANIFFIKLSPTFQSRKPLVFLESTTTRIEPVV